MTSRVARAPIPPAPSLAKRKPTPPATLVALHPRYHILHRVGSGAAGTVIHAIDNTSTLHVAVKIVPKTHLVDKACKMAVAREVSVLSKLSHPNLIQFSNAFEDAAHVYIATEFCPDGDLYHYLEAQPAALHERHALKLMRQIFAALQYLHKRGISHRDVKPENVLMGPNGKLKLADFGMCYWRRPGGDKITREHCGTPQYAPPEIMQQAPYVPEKADMWACGVVLFAMLTRTLPFTSKAIPDLKRAIINANPDLIVSNPKLSHVSQPTIYLLRSLLSLHPSHRPSPTKAIELVDDALLGVRPSRKSMR